MNFFSHWFMLHNKCFSSTHQQYKNLNLKNSHGREEGRET